jgi:hypothetical protein
LLAILESIAAEAGFCLTDGAKERVDEMLSTMTDEEWRNFGNARGIRNLFERMVSMQANRIIGYASQSIKDITVITEEDVPE